MISAGLAALTFGAGAAHADTLPNGALVQLGQYPIPSTPAAGFSGGDALPTIPGTLGNPTELFMNQGGSSSQVLGVQGRFLGVGYPDRNRGGDRQHRSDLAVPAQWARSRC